MSSRSVTPAHNGPPSPEEFQRQLNEFMRQHLYKQAGAARPDSSSEPDSTEQNVRSQTVEDFDFNRKPRDVKAYLDRFVIRQDEAKKVLSVALCDHYHQVRLSLQGKAQAGYSKQNVILIGPTGVGKTYLIKSMADMIGVPFVKADATKFSETGYVGGDVEDLVRDLLRKADGDVERAQYGIIYIDEIDKIAAASNLSGRDVSGRGVQTNLLKLMEETEVPARAPNDIAGQLQSIMEGSRGGKKTPATINTRNILFVVSGAFGGLERIVKKRARESVIGFRAETRDEERDERWLEDAQTRDFIEYGFEPEFIGRLPVRVVCQQLTVEDLFQILKNSEGSIIRQYEQSFAAYGIEIYFHDDGLRRMAELAAGEKTGARGLMTVCERIFRNLKFELPSTSVKRFGVTKVLVEDPDSELRRLLEAQEQEEHAMLRHVVHEFGRRFQEAHHLRLHFTEAAAEWLVNESIRQGTQVRDLCAAQFKDFQFGLRLIAQNTGQQEFVIDEAVAGEPDKTLSAWVVASYKRPENSAPTPPSKSD